VLHASPWKQTLDETVSTALGREHRSDPVLPGSGGPAGNARLAAWVGVLLLVLFLAELVTLIDVHALISWHLAVGVVLIPPSIAKTATTGWRIARYYTGDTSYRTAGPPPLLLRVLGPLVVLATLALLGTGLALVLLGETRSKDPLLTLTGVQPGVRGLERVPFPVDVLFLHQASFVLWGVVTGLHVLARIVPAWRLTVARRPLRVPGAAWRAVVVLLAAACAMLGFVWVSAHAGGWNQDRRRGHDHEIDRSSATLVRHGGRLDLG
jgi:hypothetical protein